MWVYINSEPGLYTVGHYAPDGTWHPDGDYNDRGEAAARCHYLNGGKSGHWDDDDRETVKPGDARYYRPPGLKGGG